MFGSMSSRNQTSTKLNDETAPSTTNDSSNEENDLSGSSLQADLTTPPKIYNTQSRALCSKTPTKDSSSPNASPSFQGLTSPTRRNRKTSNSASPGLHTRGKSEETDRTEKVTDLDEDQEGHQAAGQAQSQQQTRPSESAQPQLTPPIECASQEAQLQVASISREDARDRSPSSDGGLALSMHTASSSLGMPNSNDSLQALRKKQLKKKKEEEEEAEQIMREAKTGRSINLSEDVFEQRPAWAIAEEKRLGKLGSVRNRILEYTRLLTVAYLFPNYQRK